MLSLLASASVRAIRPHLSVALLVLGFAAAARPGAAAPATQDLAVESVSIDDVTVSTIEYTVTVRNTGTDPFPLNQAVAQGYFSVNDMIGPGDQPAGGTTLGLAGENLAPGATHQVQLAATNMLFIESYCKIIVQLSSGIDQDSANNTGLAQYAMPCPAMEPTILPNDMAVTGVTIENFSLSQIDYTVSVRNVGTNTVEQILVVAQGYLSVDDMPGGGDVPAGGTTIGPGGMFIAPGQTVDVLLSTTNAAAIASNCHVLAEVSRAGDTVASNNLGAALYADPCPPVTPTAAPCCAGDADNSGGAVNANDFLAVQANFGADNGSGGLGDADCSGGSVNANDFLSVQSQFGANCM